MELRKKQLEQMSFLKFDDNADSGSVSGYATTYDMQPDSDGDRVMPGAAGMNAFTAPMLIWHDRKSWPAGGASLTPDAYGVKVNGVFAKTQYGQDARETAKVGGFPAFSIGFTSDDYTPNEYGGVDFHSIDIKEVSLVPVPANTRALVTAVKSDDGTIHKKKMYADVEPPEGTFEAIQEDICEALTEYYSVDGIDSVYVQLLATYPERVVYAVSCYPQQPDIDGTYQVTYLRPAEDTLTLGNPTSVQIQQSIAPDEDNFTLPTAPVAAADTDDDAASASYIHMSDDTETVEKAVSDKPWSDFSQADYTIEQWRSACLIGPSEESDKKGDYKLPIKEPDGSISRAGCHAAAARLNQVDAPADDIKAAAKKLVSIYKNQLKEDPPDSLLEAAGESTGKSDTVFTFVKRGKRNATTDQKALDDAHDLIVKAGANCPGMTSGNEGGTDNDEQNPGKSNTDVLQLMADLAEFEASA